MRTAGQWGNTRKGRCFTGRLAITISTPNPTIRFLPEKICWMSAIRIRPICFSGLALSESGKIKSVSQTVCSEGSTLKTTLETLGISKDVDVTVDAVNGTTLSPQYLNSAGIITGMSKDTAANVDLYLGTQHIPISVTADTKYYQSFELYQTAKYTLSTDGYAIIEVPAYFRSGYYLINNMGFVKFLNVDRGVDESGINLNSAYYYEEKDGKTLTFYEWQEKNGVAAAGECQLLYSNFDKIHKRVEVSLNSGNVTSYVHNGNSGSIRIYYKPSDQAHDFTITWEHEDRALADLKLTMPDGTIYSKSTTPGNIMADEYGKYVIKVPGLMKGDYRFDIKGEGLGQVWVNCDESVSFKQEEAAHIEEIPETQEEAQESGVAEG